MITARPARIDYVSADGIDAVSGGMNFNVVLSVRLTDIEVVSGELPADTSALDVVLQTHQKGSLTGFERILVVLDRGADGALTASFWSQITHRACVPVAVLERVPPNDEFTVDNHDANWSEPVRCGIVGTDDAREPPPGEGTVDCGGGRCRRRVTMLSAAQHCVAMDVDVQADGSLRGDWVGTSDVFAASRLAHESCADAKYFPVARPLVAELPAALAWLHATFADDERFELVGIDDDIVACLLPGQEAYVSAARLVDGGDGAPARFVFELEGCGEPVTASFVRDAPAATRKIRLERTSPPVGGA